MPRRAKHRNQSADPPMGWASIVTSQAKTGKIHMEDFNNIITCMHPYHATYVICFVDNTSIVVDEKTYATILRRLFSEDRDRMIWFPKTKEWYLTHEQEFDFQSLAPGMVSTIESRCHFSRYVEYPVIAEPSIP